MTSAQEILKTRFGFDAFRPGQADIIDHLVSGDSVLAVMPTGAGKSLCYQIPALLFDRPTIIISPLVALMDNQVAGLREHGIDVACIHSAQSREDNVRDWKAVASGQTKLLYMSPERLMTQRMIGALGKMNPAMFVIDEAHCISKWGPAFRPEYAELSRLKTLFPGTPIAAFTATADAATREDMATQLFDTSGKVIVHGFDRPNISIAVQPAQNRKQQLLDLLADKRGQSGIVYCLSRKNTEKYADFLSENGYSALPYHAGLSPDVRFTNQERFMAEDGVIMVATIAFGMGIDKPDIRFVYHMNLPSSLEAYYQEIGRASRDGAPADTTLIYGLDDLRTRRQFIFEGSSDEDHLGRELKRLDALMAYCEASTCRRQILLGYFGEAHPPCGNCDICRTPPEMIDATEAAQAILSAMEQTSERFGAGHIISVVRGETTDRLTQFGHHELSAHGAGKSFKKPYLQALIRQMMSANLMDMDMSRYGTLSITSEGRNVLSGKATFACRKLERPGSRTHQEKRTRKQAVTQELTSDEQALLTALKAVRTEIAREIKKPAFMVFSDATLMDMVAKVPNSESEMLEVSGVGPTKMERYGETFLEVIKSH